MTQIIEKHHEIKRTAEELFAHNPDWVTFYRTTLGLHGVVRRHYPTLESLAEFEQSEVYGEVQRMLNELRKRSSGAPAPDEPTQVITVRIPKSLHDTLRSEAYAHHTSMNKLCISKLIQLIDNQHVPAES